MRTIRRISSSSSFEIIFSIQRIRRIRTMGLADLFWEPATLATVATLPGRVR